VGATGIEDGEDGCSLPGEGTRHDPEASHYRIGSGAHCCLLLVFASPGLADEATSGRGMGLPRFAQGDSGTGGGAPRPPGESTGARVVPALSRRSARPRSPRPDCVGTRDDGRTGGRGPGPPRQSTGGSLQ